MISKSEGDTGAGQYPVTGAIIARGFFSAPLPQTKTAAAAGCLAYNVLRRLR
jgi:hypothetical protein